MCWDLCDQGLGRSMVKGNDCDVRCVIKGIRGVGERA